MPCRSSTLSKISQCRKGDIKPLKSDKITKNYTFFDFFSKKFWRIKNFAYLCTRNQQWWIHLRARIPASHAGHRGSNPLSTTKNEARRCRRNSTSFVFDNMPTNLFVGHSGKNKVVDLSTPCEVILFRPPWQAEGKGVKRSERERV